MDDVIIKYPATYIYEEWYLLTDYYSLEDIYTTNWSEEWATSKQVYIPGIPQCSSVRPFA